MSDGLGVRIAGYRLSLGGPGTDIGRTPAPIPWDITDSEDPDFFALQGSFPLTYDILIKRDIHCLAKWWSRLDGVAPLGRVEVDGAIFRNGILVPSARASCYFPGQGNALSGGMAGFGILSLSEGDLLRLYLVRSDTSAAAHPQLTTQRTGIDLIRLDESFGYGRYLRAASAGAASTGSWQGLDWDVPVEEEDATYFAINTPADETQILVKEAGHHLLTFSIVCSISSAWRRSNAAVRVTLGGSQVFPICAGYIKNNKSDGCRQVILSWIGIFDNPTPNQYLVVQFMDDGSSFDVGNTATLELVRLPDSGDYMMLRNTSGTVPADQDNYPIPWTVEDEVDATSFAHAVSPNDHKISPEQDGRYLFIAQTYSDRSAIDLDRLIHRIFWYKENTSVELARGQNCCYERGYDFATGDNLTWAGLCSALLSAAGTDADILSLRHNQDAGANADPTCLYATDGLALQAVNLNSIMPLKVEAKGIGEADAGASLAVISSTTLMGMGLGSAHGFGGLYALRHAQGAISQASGHAGTASVAVGRALTGRLEEVQVTAEATLATTRGMAPAALGQALPTEATVSPIRGAPALGIVDAEAGATLSQTKGAAGLGLGTAEAGAVASRVLKTFAKPRGLGQAHGDGALGAIRHVEGLSEGGAVINSAAVSTSVTLRVIGQGWLTSHSGAVLAMSKPLAALGLGEAQGAPAATGRIRGLVGEGLATAGGELRVSLLAAIKLHAKALLQAQALAELVVTRGTAAMGLASAEGVLPLGAQLPIRMDGRGELTSHAWAPLSRTRPATGRGEAEAHVPKAQPVRILGVEGRGVAGPSVEEALISAQKPLTARGEAGAPSVASLDRIVRRHAQALLKSLCAYAELGEKPVAGFYSTTAQLCRTRLRAQWADILGVQVQYDNLPFTQPTTLHAEASVVWDDAGVEVADLSLPKDFIAATGLLEVRIRSPFANGQSGAEDAAESLVGTFRGAEVEFIHFVEPEVSLLGASGAWFEAEVRLPFWAEDSRARLAPVGPAVSGSRETTATALRARIRTEVEGPMAVPVQYENLPFDRPTDGEYLRTAIVEGGTFEPEGSDAARATHRTAGIFLVDVFAPFGTGEARTLALVDAIDDAFRIVSVQGIELGEPSVSRGVRLGAEWRRTVSIPYLADEIT